VDGHAPGLRGSEARQYIAAGISTDHECFTAEEALDKLEAGMKILIREGSAAKNFEALAGLIHDHWENMMFCSDDKHPDSLVLGHINELCARSVAKGIDVFKVLRVACINPVLHYKLPVGLLQPGDPADLIIVDDLKQFITSHTYINGVLVARQGESLLHAARATVINHFNCEKIDDSQLFTDKLNADGKLDVIEALDGQLITNRISYEAKYEGKNIISNTKDDILKIVVVNRYFPAKPAIGFIRNMGLREGAIASSVAHDSHNIVAVGADDESIVKAVNLLIDHQGGVSCAKEGLEMVLPLPVAGLMSNADGYEVARQYSAIDSAAKELGSTLSAPFMTLSFMALLVIPHLKLSDRGLFNGDSFSFC
jgi:adenine deaminase